jgi:hypothetical protein
MEYRKNLTINVSEVNGTHINFPVLVRITDDDIASRTQADGDDILFAADDGVTLLGFEIEQYNATTGSLVAWVSVPNVTNTTAKSFYLYYGNPGMASLQNATAVWNSSYSAVWHFEETSGTTLFDVKNITRNLTKASSTTPGPNASGIIGGAQTFDGSSAAADATFTGPVGNVTTQMWVKLSSVDGTHRIFLDGRADFYARLDYSSPNDFYTIYGNSGSWGTIVDASTNPSANTWYHVVSVSDAVQQRTLIYVNGILESNQSDTQTHAAPTGYYIGRYSGGGFYHYGNLDEVRILSVARNSQWIQTEYNNQREGSAFLSAGNQEYQSSWYNTSWLYRKNITIDASQVNGSHYNFPFLVRIANDSQINASMQTDADDLLFTSSDGITKLDHEVEFYNSSTGQLVAWVRIPYLTNTSNTTLSMYYGNLSVVNQQNKTGVWDTNYSGVWHHHDNSTTVLEDSTIFSNNGTKIGSPSPSLSIGVADGGQVYNAGVTNSIDIGNPSSLNIAGNMTISAWVNFSVSHNNAVFAARWGSDQSYGLFVTVTNDILSYCIRVSDVNKCADSSSTYNDNLWHYVVGNFNGTNVSLQIDGTGEYVVGASTTGPIDTPAQSIRFGGYNNGGGAFGGYMDEVRISNTSRSIARTITEYQNQRIGSTFMTVQSQENRPTWYYNWTYRKNLTVNASDIVGDHSDFPFLVRLNESDLAGRARTDGKDILFTDAIQNKLHHQIEHYNATTGALVAWVRIPTLTNVTNTTLLMYFGNLNASDQGNPAGVWGGYYGVWHFSEDPSAAQFNDSTNYSRSGNASGMSASDRISSMLDKGAYFDGTNNYVDLGSWFSYQNYTISLWIAPGSAQNQYADILDNNHNTGVSWVLQQNNNNLNQYSHYTSDTSSDRFWAADASTWHYLVLTRNGSIQENRVYINGSFNNAGNGTGSINYDGSQYLRISRWGGGGRYWNGSLDELRIYPTARSNNWIQTEYNNQRNGSVSYTITSFESNFPVEINSVNASSLPYYYGAIVAIRANVTGSQLYSVNFTITAPNGTIMVNNSNGTNMSTLWNSSAFNLSAAGVWNYTVSAQSSDGYVVNTSEQLRFLMITTNMSTRFSNGSRVNISGTVTNSSNTSLATAAVRMYFNGTAVVPYPGYNYLIGLNITAGNENFSNGSLVEISLNTATLVAAGDLFANGSDLRVYYHQNGTLFEINRSLLYPNSSASIVQFRTLYSIAANATDSNYRIYYGKTAAGEPLSNVSALVNPSFEMTNLSGWLTASSPWYPDITVVNTGVASARSGGIANSQATWIQQNVTVYETTNLTFYWRTSTEGCCDFITFYIDGVSQASASGETAWAQKNFTLTAGNHMLVWNYTKDFSSSSGSDAVWVDDIRLKNLTTIDASYISYSLDNQGFESGSLTSWNTSGSASWSVQGTTVYNGSYAAQSGAIGSNQYTSLTKYIALNNSRNLTFQMKVSSEGCCDPLIFYADTTAISSISGESGWVNRSYGLGPGIHLLNWTFSNDFSFSSGSNAGWVDNLIAHATSTQEINFTLNDQRIIYTNASGEFLVDVTLPNTTGQYQLLVNSSVNGEYGQSTHLFNIYQYPTIDTSWTNQSAYYNGTVKVTANVTDDNLHSVNFTLYAPNGTIIINNVNMTSSGINWTSQSFRLDAIGRWNYTLAALDLDGNLVLQNSSVRFLHVTASLSSGVALPSTLVSVNGSVVNSTNTSLSNVNVLCTNNMSIPCRNNATWYGGTSWLYRRSISVNISQVNGSHTDFPMMISITNDSLLAAHALSNGDVILFANESLSKFDHEIELFNSSTGALVAWVRIPQLSNSTNVTFYMYYGNSGSSNQQNATGVWDSNYRFVLHMNGTTPNLTDSTNARNGTKKNATVPNGSSSLIGFAQNFSQAGGSMVNVSDATHPTAYTISAWVRPQDITSTGIFVRTTSGGPTSAWSHELRMTSGSNFQHYTYDGGAPTVTGSTTAVAGNSYYVVAVAQNSGSARLYINGVEEGTSASVGTLWTGGDRYIIGANDGNSNGYFDGIIDEVRFSSSVRSANRIQTEYNNQRNNSVFYTMSGELHSNFITNSSGQYLGNFTSPNTTGNYLIILNATSGDEYGQTFVSISVQGIPVIVTDTTNGTPYFNASVRVVANVTDFDNDLHSVNFTVTMPNGSIIINNINGTISGELWQSPAFTLNYSGRWNYSITALDVQGHSISINGTIRFITMIGNISPTILNASNSFTVFGQINDSQLSPVVGAIVRGWTNGQELSSTNWSNYSFAYRKALLVNRSLINGTHTNFTLVVSIANDSQLAANAQSDGDDLYFTTIDGARLSHEIELFNATSGSLIAWVFVNLTNQTDAVFYLYYGNSSVSNQQNVLGAWSPEYQAVWHMAETSGTSIADSRKIFNLTMTAGYTGVGHIGAGLNNTGSGQGATVAYSSSSGLDFTGTSKPTISFWLNVSSLAGDSRLMESVSSGAWGVEYTTAGLIRLITYGGAVVSWSNALSADNIFHHYAFSHNGSHASLYIDGVLNSTQAYTPGWSSSTRTLYVGGDASYPLRGRIDEVHIASQNKSADWIRAEYENQKRNSLMISVANQETFNVTNATGHYVQTFVAPSVNGNYTVLLNVSVNDEYGQIEHLYTVIGVPNVTIISPAATTYTTNSIPLTFSASHVDGIASCWYTNASGVNVSLSSCANTTFIGVVGSQTITLYANSTSGYLGNASVTFTINLPPRFNVSSPTAITYYRTNMNLTYAVQDEDATGACNVQLNGVNLSFWQCSNTTLTHIHFNDSKKMLAFDFTENAATAYDRSSYRQNGTFQGNAAYNASGAFSSSASFDGSGDYISISSPTLPVGDDPYTIMAWIKPTAMGAYGIAGWGNYGSGNQVNAFRLTPTGLVNYWWSNDLSVTTSDLSGSWHHVVATFNGSLRAIYVDGVQVGNDTPSGHNVPNTNNFRVGSTNSGEYFSGSIDELAIYNRSYSAQEIEAIYKGLSHLGNHTLTVYANDSLGTWNSTAVTFNISDAQPMSITIGAPQSDIFTNSSQLLQYSASDSYGVSSCKVEINGQNSSFPLCHNTTLTYVHYNDSAKVFGLDFSEGSGTSAYNRVNGSSHAFNGNTAWNTSGRFGTGVQFDGDDDYINISTQDFTGNFSMGFWFYSVSWNPLFNGFISKQDTYAGMDWVLFYCTSSCVSGANEIQFWFGNSAAVKLFQTHGVNPSLNQWHHLVLTKNSSNYSLFIDGAYATSQANATAIPTGDMVRLGLLAADNTSYGFNGTMDEFVIYNRTLGADEIRKHYLSRFNGNVTLRVYANDSLNRWNSSTTWFFVNGPTCTPFSSMNWTLDIGDGCMITNLSITVPHFTMMSTSSGNVTITQSNITYLNRSVGSFVGVGGLMFGNDVIIHGG